MCVWMDGSDLNSDLVNITLWRELGRVASDRSVSDHVSACCNASAYAVEVKSPQLLPVGATLQVSVTGSAHASAVECTGKRNLQVCRPWSGSAGSGAWDVQDRRAGWCGHNPRKKKGYRSPVSRARDRESVRLLAGHVKRSVHLMFPHSRLIPRSCASVHPAPCRRPG